MERRLAAILVADVVEYSRLMGEDEVGTLVRLKTHRKDLIDPKIAAHGGHIVKTTGDGMLVEFPSAVGAVQCAFEVQQAMVARNADVPEDRRITFRVGINVGDIIVEDDDIYGDGVNIAARLEKLAEPGGICVARNVFNQVKNKVGLGFEDLGEHEVKNIAEPVQIYRVEMVGAATPARPSGGFRSRYAAVAAAVLVAAIVGGGAWWWQAQQSAVTSADPAKMAYKLPDQPSIAVMPFDNLSGDERYDRFVDGITEDLISDLARYRDLFVIARHSTFVYKDKAVDVRQVAQDLGVHYVLEGSIQATPSQVKVTAQLIDALTGHHIWADQYSSPIDEIFSIQDEVVGKVSAALTGAEGALADAGRKVARRKPPESLDAYELNLLGVENKHKFTAEGNQEAKRLLLQAIELDQGFARAYVNLSWVSFNDALYDWVDSPEDSMKRAFEYAQKAVDLDDTDAEAHAALGYGYAYVKSNLERATAEFDRALKLGPNYADTLVDIGWTVGTLFGKGREGLDLISRALRLNPNYPDWYEYGLETAAYYARDFKQTIAASRRVRSHTVETRLYAALSYAQLGDEENAAKQLEEVLKLDPEFTAKKWLGIMPHPNQGAETLFLEGARKAGLPEK